MGHLKCGPQSKSDFNFYDDKAYSKLLIIYVHTRPQGHMRLRPAYRWDNVGNPIDGVVQDFSISKALAMEILQSCTKPSQCILL